jgi:hypothetical protein
VSSGVEDGFLLRAREEELTAERAVEFVNGSGHRVALQFILDEPDQDIRMGDRSGSWTASRSLRPALA